jgi:septal ring factor EnvC (AmiA/AmiB activator)
MNLDDLRRKLRVTEQELADTRKRLDASEKRCAELDKAKTALEGKAHQAVALLLPEGTSLSTKWDNYEEPGY